MVISGKGQLDNMPDVVNPFNDSLISERPGDEISDFEQDESDFELSDDSDSVDTEG